MVGIMESTASTGIIESSHEASKSAFQSIKRVEGVLLPIERVASKFQDSTYGPPKDQAQITLEGAAILEMDEGVPMPDLKDDKYVFWLNYAKKGEPKPSNNTFFVKGFMKSAEALDAKRRGVKPEEGRIANLYGTSVVLERQRVFLFKKPKDDGSGEKEEFYQEGLVFALDDGSDSGNLNDYVKGLVVGLGESAALRAIILDSRAKQHPEYRTAHEQGTLADMLGMTIVDGKYA